MLCVHRRSGGASEAAPAAERGEPAKAAETLRVGGKDFHVVAAVLMMLGLVEAYLQFQDVVPAFAGEVAHRVVELLKVRGVLPGRLQPQDPPYPGCRILCLSSASSTSPMSSMADLAPMIAKRSCTTVRGM